MAVQIGCPCCGAACLIAAEHLGRAVRCFACTRVFVPTTSPAGPAPSSGGDSPSSDDFPLPTFDALPQHAVAAAFHLDVATATSPGKVRTRNEDCCLVRRQTWSRENALRELTLLCVADGMGGHDGGQRASSLTVQAVNRALGGLFDDALADRLAANLQDDIERRLRGALTEASRTVHAAASEPRAKGMGAAAVVALMWGQTAHIAHVGDCRAYHFHAGVLTQLTRDQTLVQRMVELGKLAAHEARHHAARNELTQAIGRRPDVEAEVARVTLGREDWLVLACDGLHAHLEAHELRKEIELALPSAAFLAQHLVKVADDRGGSDNCTVVAVHCA
jgi:protein phosphatase